MNERPVRILPSDTADMPPKVEADAEPCQLRPDRANSSGRCRKGQECTAIVERSEVKVRKVVKLDGELTSTSGSLRDPGRSFAVLAAKNPSAVARYLVKLVGIAVAYFVLAKIDLLFATVNPSASPVWPPSGLALAAALLWGYRVWPAIFGAAFLANALTAGSLATSAAIGAGSTLEALVGAYLVAHWSGGCNTFETPTGIARFGLIVLLAATPISATIGVTSLSLAGYAAWSDFGSIWITWWLGDVTGAIIVAPVIVLWTAAELRRLSRQDLGQFIALMIATAFIGVVAFSPVVPPGVDRSALAFLSILPLLWAALQRGQRETATALLALAVFAVWGTASQGGPFVRQSLNESFLLLIAFVVSIAVPTLALSAEVASRRAADVRSRFLHDVSDTLRSLGDPDAIMGAAAAAVGRHLGASRAGYSEIDETDRARARGQWHVDYLPDLKGRFSVRAFGAQALEQLRRGETRVAEDMESISENQAFFPMYRAVQMRAHVTVPLVKDGRLRAALHVFQDRPRRWMPAEVDLCEEIAERTWAAVERARAETAMIKEIAERRRHEQRLARMVEELDKTNAQLTEQARVLDLANVLVTNMRDEITLWNEGARRRYGWTREEALGKISQELLRTQFSVPFLEIKQLLLTRGEWEGEVVQRTRDGQRIVCQSHWQLHRDSEGTPCAILKTNTDITERKRYEEHFELIMRELSHRSKNLLAVVQSIARQVANQTENFRDFEAAFSARLQAFAQTHDLLVTGGWRGATIRDLVRSQLAPFGDFGAARLQIDGPDLLLNPAPAEQLGLALHELGTNATKYGAFSVPEGAVSVRWELDQTPSNRVLRIRWRESGGPTIAGTPARKGFGHLVLTKVVPVSLKGTARLVFEPPGVSWELEVPTDNLFPEE
jgi:PAS domain S-box-containing protein